MGKKWLLNVFDLDKQGCSKYFLTIFYLYVHWQERSETVTCLSSALK